MNSDCAISIGSTHAICQDYARAGQDKEGMPYVIISDGCSSSAETDIGSRLLVLAAEKNIDLLGIQTEEFYEKSVVLAETWTKYLGLPEIAIDATLVVAKMVKDQPFAAVYGDGLIVAGKRDENGKNLLAIHQVVATQNFPFYPSYLLKPNRLKSMPPDNKLEVSCIYKETNGTPPIVSFATFCPMNNGRFHAATFAKDSDFIAILTDGAGSFLAPEISNTSKSNNNVELELVLSDLVGFKNFNAGFVQRRMQKFQKETKAKGWQHYDDLTVGAIALR